MYETIAQVAPVMLLAMVFESSFLRTYDSANRSGWWTNGRVRLLGATVVAAFGVAEGLSLMVIVDAIDPADWIAGCVSVGVFVLLGVLLSRVFLDIWHTTAPPSADPANESELGHP